MVDEERSGLSLFDGVLIVGGGLIAVWVAFSLLGFVAGRRDGDVEGGRHRGRRARRDVRGRGARRRGSHRLGHASPRARRGRALGEAGGFGGGEELKARVAPWGAGLCG